MKNPTFLNFLALFLMFTGIFIPVVILWATTLVGAFALAAYAIHQVDINQRATGRKTVSIVRVCSIFLLLYTGMLLIHGPIIHQ